MMVRVTTIGNLPSYEEAKRVQAQKKGEYDKVKVIRRKANNTFDVACYMRQEEEEND